MSNTEQQQYLSFEKPIFELEQRLESLTEASASSDVSDEIQRLRLGLADLKKKVYANLNRWNVVEVSRHPNRPQTADYLDRVFDEFVELHGDRFFGDDRAMRTGWAKIDGQKVMVVGHNKRLLKNALDEAGTQLLKRLIHEASNVECVTGCSVDEAVRDGDRVVSVRLSDGTDVPCDALVMAVGVRPATALAEAAGAVVERGIVIDEHLQTTLPDVFAAGDCAQVRNALTGQLAPLALWGNAVRQGRAAGLWMAGSANAEPYVDDYAENAVDFFEISLLSCGIVNPEPDGGFDELVFAEEDRYAKFVIRDDRLVGYVLLNRPDHAGIYNSMIRNGVAVGSLSKEMFARVPEIIDLPPELRRRYQAGEE